MKKESNYEGMTLIEHLQVLDEPLSSLYVDRTSGRYFISIRLYEERPDKSYLFLEVFPEDVLDYMNGRVGLRYLFETRPSFYYLADNEHILSLRNFSPLSKEESCKKLFEDSSLDDLYDSHLAYRSTSLKNYLKSCDNMDAKDGDEINNIVDILQEIREETVAANDCAENEHSEWGFSETDENYYQGKLDAFEFVIGLLNKYINCETIK